MQVVDTVLQLIRGGAYSVGDRLPSEWELVRLCSVGRSAVREGIRELAARGLVEVRHGKGTYVLSLRPDLLVSSAEPQMSELETAARELLEVRLIFEPKAARLAAERRTKAELDQLRHDVERLAEAVSLGFRPPEDLGFHLDILRAAHNTALLRLGGSVVSFYARDETIPMQRDVDEHGAIFQAIAEQDSDSAETAMHRHLEFEIQKRERRSRASGA